MSLDQEITLISARAAGKVVYFATILHAQNLKVATLLNADTAGDNAAQQETLIHKRILRTASAT